MNSIDIQSFVHELFPEIQAIVGSIDYLLLKTNKEFFKIIDFHDINSLLVSQ
jgi:hypothetical protein